MLPVLAHHCENCHYNTPVSFTASVFSEQHYCNHCGLRSELRVQEGPEQNAHMEQDELASLFSRQLNFAVPTPPPDESDQTQRQQIVIEGVLDPHPTTFASTHYTHTHHVTPARFHTPPEPPSPRPQGRDQSDEQRQQPSDEELVMMLIRNWIDPSLLSPAQADLFRNADPDQRLRLLELWRISPPDSGAYGLPQDQASWTETSLQKEELLARSRDEHRKREMQLLPQSNENTALNTAVAPPGDLTRPSSAPADSRPHAEPYMMSGYEMLARRDYEAQVGGGAQPLQESLRYNRATDPAFKSTSPKATTASLWQKVDVMQDMENAYGNFEAMREKNGGDTIARSGLEMDEEMIM